MHFNTWKIRKILKINKLASKKFKILVGACCIALILLHQYQPLKTPIKISKRKTSGVFRDRRNRETDHSDHRWLVNKNEIRILQWTAHWGARYSHDKVLTRKKCPYLKPIAGPVFDIPCRITFDRRYLEWSNVLVFHSGDLRKDDIPKRSWGQLWVYSQRECPIYTKLNLRDYPNVFNWTMTYRLDSDVYHPYGHVVPLMESKTTHSFRSRLRKLGKRQQLLAWIVSDAESHSKRELFAKQLQKYIPLSIYGKCGEPCPTSSAQECYDHVAKSHKFYLSFENSLCMDYVTEKFFHALNSSMVPIVYGGGESEEYSAIAPKGSYIDARDFRSPKELAEYLVRLDHVEEEYLKYFEWKKTSKVVSSQGWCSLCQRVFEHLNSPQGPGSSEERKEYKDLFSWWNFKRHDPGEDRSNATPSWEDVIEESSKSGVGNAICTPPIKALIGSEGEKEGEGVDVMKCPRTKQ